MSQYRCVSRSLAGAGVLAFVVSWVGVGSAQLTIRPLGQLKGSINAIQISADGQRIWISAQDEIRLFDANGTELLVAQLPMRQITSMAVDADRKRLYAAGGDPDVAGVWSMLDSETLNILQTHRIHDDVITSISLSPDRTRLATGSIDQNVAITSLDDGSQTLLSEHSKAVTGVLWLDSDTVATTAEDLSIRVWSATEKHLVGKIIQHTAAVLGCVAIHSADRESATMATWGRDRTIRIWQPGIGRMIRFVALDSIPRVAIWDAERQRLVVGDQSGSLHWIDVETAKIEHSQQVSDHWISALTTGGRSKCILVGSSSGEWFALNGSHDARQ